MQAFSLAFSLLYGPLVATCTSISSITPSVFPVGQLPTSVCSDSPVTLCSVMTLKSITSRRLSSAAIVETYLLKKNKHKNKDNLISKCLNNLLVLRVPSLLPVLLDSQPF